MAVNPSRRPARPSLLWSRLHFVIRFLGLTGAVVLLVGTAIVGVQALLPSVEWEIGPIVTDVGWQLIYYGGGVAAFALLIEIVNIAFLVAGRRSLLGANALFQVVLATVLLVGVNLFSAGISLPRTWNTWLAENVHLPGHHARFDLTRDQRFTLPADLREQLAQLDRGGETTVVVYLTHNVFGGLSEKRNRYEYAAERKVVEEVKDLVAELRDIGPQLRVEVLDVEEQDYADKLRRLSTRSSPRSVAVALVDLWATPFTKDVSTAWVLASNATRFANGGVELSPLRRAIDQTLESSIFITADNSLQRMSLNELYQLDKVSSEDANNGRGNLVLLGQGADGRGVGPFVRRVLNLEQRMPRVGILTIHELLTTRGSEDTLNMAGLRKTLTDNGFDVRDVILKKGWNTGPSLEPAADTFEESKLDRLESELEELDAELKVLRKEASQISEEIRDVTPLPGEDEAKRLEELSKKFTAQLRGKRLTPQLRQQVLEYLAAVLAGTNEDISTLERERDRLRQDRTGLDVDRAREARRMTDVRAKLTYTLADCDLVVIPRMTRRSRGQDILARLYSLKQEQVDALKDYLKSGKPILACLGPINEPSREELRGLPIPAGPDPLENLLTELGFHLSEQTVLFSSDSKSFADRRGDLLATAEVIEPPPLDFTTPPVQALAPWLAKKERAELHPNPIYEGLRVLSRSVGKEFDLRVRFPRPVYFTAKDAATESFEPTFLLSKDGWNEDKPFPSGTYRPRYTAPLPSDPKNGTEDARRRGHFPVAAAEEVAIPKDWGAEKGQTARVAVIGQGEIFVGGQLSPVKERLFLQTANWLLGRDDYLPRADHPWSFPRVDLPPESPGHWFWVLGVWIGLPVLAAYVGLVVLLLRWVR
jgi:hypothetical protein